MTSPHTAFFRVNSAAISITGFEACLTYGMVAYSVHTLGSISSTNLLGAVFWLALILSELPTGYLLDRYGPRLCMLGSLGLRMAAFMIFYLGQECPSVLYLANFIAGVSVTFLSGIYLAQLHREWVIDDATPDIPRAARSAILVRSTGLIIGTLVGHLITSRWGLAEIWLIVAIWALISAIHVSLFWRTGPRDSQEHTLASQHYFKALKFLRSSKTAASAMTQLAMYRSLVYLVSTNSLFILVPELEANQNAMLLFYLIAGFSGFVTSAIARRFQFLNGTPSSWPTIFMACCVLATAYGPRALAFFAFALYLIGSTLFEVIFRSRFYSLIDFTTVGAISSIQGLLENGFALIIFLASAILLRYSSVQTELSICAFILFAQSCFAIFLRNYNRVEAAQA